jgi:membrane-bound serine protease (ClpP class)
MVGEVAQARSAIVPGSTGTVAVHGEIWQARSGAGVAAGQAVRVVAVEGLTLLVEPAGEPPAEGVTS